MKRPLESRGFTIVELMISTAIFSVVLLLCATAIVQVGRLYYKGVSTTRLQETTRRALDDITQSIQFGARTDSGSFSTLVSTTGKKAYCLGGVRYTFADKTYSMGANDTEHIAHVLWKDSIGSNTLCTASNVDLTAAQPTPTGQELLADNMRVVEFTIVPAGNLWDVSLVVSFGDSDLFDAGSDYRSCISSRTGGQFCGVSILNTTAVKRL